MKPSSTTSSNISKVPKISRVYQSIKYLDPGSSNPILWGEATKIGDQLFWCEGNATVAVPVTVNGNTSEPFLLVSLPQEKPNLNAVSVGSNMKLQILYCLHSPEIKQKCDSGRRSKVLSPLEKFVETYGIGIY